MNINIVSFNTPYPADYGGVIDVFYKMKALHELGVKIILHTFEYGREPASELKNYCEQVYYYKRKTGIRSQFSSLPYIVKSRDDKALLNNLLRNDYPILFEGLHTCFYLDHPSIKNRLKIVRPHNIEHLYYRGLAKTTELLYEKIFFTIEKKRLIKYEKILHHSDLILPLSNVEKSYFETLYGRKKVTFIPIFHQNDVVEAKEIIDNPYLLFHGDLSVSENSIAASFLIDNVAKEDTSLFLVIAGKNPPSRLKQLGENLSNVNIVANPSFEEMQSLIKNASISILYAQHAAGVKLKLLNSLFSGRFCLANQAIIEGSGLDDLCLKFPEKKVDSLRLIHKYYLRSFDEDEKKKRQEVLDALYNNLNNAQKILNLVKDYSLVSKA